MYVEGLNQVRFSKRYTHTQKKEYFNSGLFVLVCFFILQKRKNMAK